MKSLRDISLSRRANGQQLDWPRETGNTLAVSITLDFDVLEDVANARRQ